LRTLSSGFGAARHREACGLVFGPAQSAPRFFAGSVTRYVLAFGQFGVGRIGSLSWSTGNLTVLIGIAPIVFRMI
jgi:hypothetical protein